MLDLLFKYTERTGSMSGEETRDMLFGRLFGLMSIITAGMLTKPSTTFDDAERILDSLKDICQAKSYLIEVSYHIVVQMLAAVSKGGYGNGVYIWILITFVYRSRMSNTRIRSLQRSLNCSWTKLKRWIN